MNVDFSHIANQKCLLRITPKKQSLLDFANKRECNPRDVDNVYSRINMNEEVVKLFWDKITAHLPQDSRWIVYGRAVLVNPRSGVIFGVMFSNVSFALRLPTSLKTEVLERNGFLKQELYGKGIVDIQEEMGEDWVLFYAKDPEKLLDICVDAYNYSGQL